MAEIKFAYLWYENSSFVQIKKGKLCLSYIIREQCPWRYWGYSDISKSNKEIISSSSLARNKENLQINVTWIGDRLGILGAVH